MVCRFTHIRGHALRLSDPGDYRLPRFCHLRRGMRDCGHHRHQGHCQMVYRTRTGTGHGSASGAGPSGHSRGPEPCPSLCTAVWRSERQCGTGCGPALRRRAGIPCVLRNGPQAGQECGRKHRKRTRRGVPHGRPEAALLQQRLLVHHPALPHVLCRRVPLPQVRHQADGHQIWRGSRPGRMDSLNAPLRNHCAHPPVRIRL